MSWLYPTTLSVFKWMFVGYWQNVIGDWQCSDSASMIKASLSHRLLLNR